MSILFNKKKVSVLVPVFNCEAFVEDAIHSIIGQSYKCLEILVCDDGSTDNSYQKIKEMESRDSRIRVLRNDVNKGKVYTIRKLIDVASGDFISFLDSDDFIAAEKIERQLNFLLDNQEYSFIGTSYVRVTEKGTRVSSEILDFDDESIKNRILNSHGMAVCCGSIMCRSSAAKSVGGYNYYFEDCNGEDLDFVARLFQYGKGVSIPDELYFYRFRSDSLTRRVFDTPRQRHSHEVISFLFKQRMQNSGMDSLNSNLDGLEDFIAALSLPYEIDPGLMNRKVAIDLALNRQYLRSFNELFKGSSLRSFKSSLFAACAVTVITIFPIRLLIWLKEKTGFKHLSKKV